MRRPHVYQRSGSRRPRPEQNGKLDRKSAAEDIAARLEPLIVSADQLGCEKLADLLDDAKEEAQRIAGAGSS